MDWRAVVGRNVRRLRQERGLTQEQLAHEAELDLTYVGGIERGKRNPSLLVLVRIAAALETDLPSLVDAPGSGAAIRAIAPLRIVKCSVRAYGSHGPVTSQTDNQ